MVLVLDGNSEIIAHVRTCVAWEWVVVDVVVAEEAEDPLPRPVTVHSILLDVLTIDIAYMVNAKLHLQFFLFSKIFDSDPQSRPSWLTPWLTTNCRTKFEKHASNLMLNYTIMSINMIKIITTWYKPWSQRTGYCWVSPWRRGSSARCTWCRTWYWDTAGSRCQTVAPVIHIQPSCTVFMVITILSLSFHYFSPCRL